jgi:hypothetical protein
MPEVGWEARRELRVKLLKISDEIQDLSVQCRSLGLDQDYSTSLNNLQIKITELIGRLWNEK